jgi:alpha-tubulin suppressor-like RCC1 family protein
MLAGCGRLGFDSLPATSDVALPFGPVAIATGDQFTCAIARGQVSCWGEGTGGELGNAMTQTFATPQLAAAGITNPVELGSGLQHMCVLDATGAVACWGANTHGQLAQPGSGISPVPIAISGLPLPVQHLVVGGDHSCALLTDASLWCWGKNTDGEVGVPTATNPVRTPMHALDDVIVASAGDATTCAVKSDNSVWCWGTDAEGELGDGLTGTTRATPMAITGLVATQVTCGDKHCCALVTGDHYSCWGYNNDGELGDTTTTTRPSPNPPSSTGGFAQLVAGNDHVCAINVDRSLSCWGTDYEGELGDGAPNKTQTSPVAVMTTGPFVALDAGGHQSCAIRADGSVACWGDSSTGQVGDGTIAEWSPRQVTLPGPATAVAAGSLHTCAVVGGVPYCWGSDWFAQIGDGSSLGDRATPVAITGLPTITQMALGEFHSCALTSTGTVYCWGANNQGQLGDGSTTRRLTPALSMMTGVQRLSAGAEYTCGRSTTDVQCWGDDEYGQIGDNGAGGTTQKSPVSLGIANPTDLGAGGTYGCAVTAQLTCWGENENGQLGIGTTTAMEPQRQVAGSWQTVAAGNGHTCAKSSTNAVFCWGDNGSGQLGDGTRTNQSSPEMITVPGATPDLELGDRHSCANTTVGLYCWGGGTHGEMGDGAGHDRLTPTLVPSFTAMGRVAAGDQFTCAIDPAGAVWCWGDNSRGQIGIGTISARLTPVEIALP